MTPDPPLEAQPGRHTPPALLHRPVEQDLRLGCGRVGPDLSHGALRAPRERPSFGAPGWLQPCQEKARGDSEGPTSLRDSPAGRPAESLCPRPWRARVPRSLGPAGVGVAGWGPRL